ncbi:hypothetical protein HYX04_01095 [Candidatus Woesearchaeota archaeon]|nr:hypothetical protein [Candidatus Woesearchaeota archaeon]
MLGLFKKKAEPNPVKDVYILGINSSTIGGIVDGGITSVVLDERDTFAKPGVLIQGHTFVTFPQGTMGYVGGRPTELRKGDYVRLHDAPIPSGTQ